MGGGNMGGSRRVFRALLRLYPSSFRESVGDDLVETLVARRRDARAGCGPVGRGWFWLVEVPRFAWDGVLERVRGWTGGGADARHALRLVRRAPAFHGLAVVVMALGIGVTTTIVAVTDAVVFRPLPFADADGLYLIRSRFGELMFGSNSLPNLRAVAGGTADLEWVAGAYDWSPALSVEGEPVRGYALTVTRGYLSGLGARARLGRLLTDADHQAGAAAAAVVSWGEWQRAWGGDASAIGRPLYLDGRPYTLVGVMERSFRDPEPIESGTRTSVWVPAPDGDTAFERRTNYTFQLIARVRRGASLPSLEPRLVALGHGISAAYPDNIVDGDSLELVPVPLKEATVADSRARFLLMLGAVLLLLLLSCVNVANLFLAHGNARGPELAVRRALGAGRGRITRQLFMESLVTTGLAGALGFLLGVGGLGAFVALAPGDTPRLHEAVIDGRVLALAAVITLLTALVSGLVPALRAAGPDALVPRGTRGTPGRRASRIQSALVGVEIALALILVTGSVLLLRSFAGLLRADVGFDPAGLVVADIRPPGGADRAAQRVFFEQVLERASVLPGVRAASLLYTAPGSGGGMWARMSAEGADPAGPEPPFVRISTVLGDLFGTLGIRLRSGRAFGDVREGDPPVVVLNESAAHLLFTGVEDPVGRRLRFGTPGSDEPLREVIGVVPDVAQRGPGEEYEPQVYAPATQSSAMRYSLVLRMGPGVAPPAGAIRGIVNDVSAGVPVDRISTMDELFADSMAEARFIAFLLSTFAALAFMLAGVGTYGTASYAVTRRLREMGIRLALGAGGGSILAMMLRRAGLTVGLGIGAGAGAAWSLSRFLESYVFGITAHDPASFLAAGSLIAISAILASLVPAIRAARVDPNRVLRVED